MYHSPKVAIVILNWNNAPDTISCLDSVSKLDYDNYYPIVVDNGSRDNSVAQIMACHSSVKILETGTNLGYAEGNNVGITAAIEWGADWILVLNEDTILAPDCLDRLVEAGQSDPTIGIVGPMVYHHSASNIIQTAGGMLGPYWNSIHLGRDEPDQGQFIEVREVEWISGCGILVRREAVMQAGLIDERYFLYWEEIEWCIRISRAGWKIIHVPRAKMWHKGVTVDHRPKPSVSYYATRNRLLTLATHHASPAVWAHVWAQMLRTLTSWTVKPSWRNMREHRDAMWRGMLDFLRGNWGR